MIRRSRPSQGAGVFRYDGLGNIRQRAVGARTVGLSYNAANQLSAHTDTAPPANPDAASFASRGEALTGGATMTRPLWTQPSRSNRLAYERSTRMSGKRYTPEEIISKLRAAEVYLAEGLTVGEVIRRLGVNKITYYRWRQEYGGMKVDQAKRLRDLEKENARLKRLLADAELDKAILKEAASGNW